MMALNSIRRLSTSLNTGMKTVEMKWMSKKSFEVIHDACLEDGDLATKLVLLIASRTFLSQEIHQQNIRLMFLRKLQENFEGSVNLKSAHPNLFRNSVQLMGDFFNKARLANGRQFSFMATPLLSYLDMLLETGDPLDLKLFVIQFYLNGNCLKQESPDKVASILSKIRLKICSDKICTKEAKLWLLLAIEVSDNRFSLLPADIQKFYQEQLGDHAMACFQGSHGVLTVQTADNSKTLDNYQSNVHVLQVSTDSLTDTACMLNNLSDSGSSANCSSGFQSDHSKISSGIITENSSNLHNGVKSGRPILGVGARLQRNRNQSDSYDIWEAEKSNLESAAWITSRSTLNPESEIWHTNKPPKEGPGDVSWRDRDSKKVNDQRIQRKDWDKKKDLPKMKKGWEHDDRFDTDYR
ncbi:uncharacterized protein LOC125504954 [Dendroctonus ponderosae]|uniref:uncharacterized protein LOC125504954 n=1 Tax=Dendroctonus ponderosae TaxID=77166 RepID=UPI00203641BB|nr:uncharacterized protein LOC125504954 [Dendroctonus ponderosae]